MPDLVPSAYHVKIAAQRYSQSELEYEKATKIRCPNYLHSDGKIYASAQGEPYVAVTVSPYHSNFKTQIETAVWPVVNAFTEKGYLTVSSCGGHKDPWWEYYVTLAVGSEEQLDRLILDLANVEHTYVEKFQSLANVLQYIDNDRIKFRPLEELENNLNDEYRDLNILFNRHYKKYYYLKLRFHYEKFALFFNPFNIFASHIFHQREIKEFNLWKENLLNYVSSEEFELFYG